MIKFETEKDFLNAFEPVCNDKYTLIDVIHTTCQPDIDTIEYLKQHIVKRVEDGKYFAMDVYTDVSFEDCIVFTLYADEVIRKLSWEYVV